MLSENAVNELGYSHAHVNRRTFCIYDVPPITQPGSSVATSLADGEAVEKYVLFCLGLQDSKQRERHVALLEVRGMEFKIMPRPLRTVRLFVIEEVVEQGGRRGRTQA